MRHALLRRKSPPPTYGGLDVVRLTYLLRDIASGPCTVVLSLQPRESGLGLHPKGDLPADLV